MNSLCYDLDICVYGLFCNPCLFGENSSHVTAYPGCVAQTIALIIVTYSVGLTGLFAEELLCNGSEVLSSINGLATSCITSGVIASYTCGTRTKIREKYGVQGTSLDDFCIHCFCSPCAVCQEAQEIRHRTKNDDPLLPPEYQEMTL